VKRRDKIQKGNGEWECWSIGDVEKVKVEVKEKGIKNCI